MENNLIIPIDCLLWLGFKEGICRWSPKDSARVARRFRLTGGCTRVDAIPNPGVDTRSPLSESHNYPSPFFPNPISGDSGGDFSISPCGVKWSISGPQRNFWPIFFKFGITYSNCNSLACWLNLFNNSYHFKGGGGEQLVLGPQEVILEKFPLISFNMVENIFTKMFRHFCNYLASLALLYTIHNDNWVSAG